MMDMMSMGRRDVPPDFLDMINMMDRMTKARRDVRWFYLTQRTQRTRSFLESMYGIALTTTGCRDERLIFWTWSTWWTGWRRPVGMSADFISRRGRRVRGVF